MTASSTTDDGIDGIDAILIARLQEGSDVAFATFEVLALERRDVMAEPWTDRRKRLFAARISSPVQDEDY